MMNWRLGTALLMSSVLLVGCDDDDDDPIEPVPGVAAVRFVHASGASPAVNITVDDAAAANNLAFGTSAPYQDVEEGSRTFEVTEAGGAAAAFDTVRTMVEDERVSFVVVGAAGALSSLILDDDNAAPAAGMTRLRIVHASPTAGAVDIFVTAPDEDLSLATPVMTNVANGDFETLTEMAGGDYQIRVVATGTTDPVVVNSGPQTFAAGSVRTIIVADNPAGSAEPYRTIILTDL